MGGAIQIQAFCSAFQLNVAVFLAEAEVWVVMEPIVKYSTELPTVFLMLRSNHFEPITRLTCVQTTSYNQVQLGKKGKPATEVMTPNAVNHLNPLRLLYDGGQPDNPQKQGVDKNFVQSGDLCSGCGRVSTLCYPFNLKTVSWDKIIQRKFGRMKKCLSSIVSSLRPILNT